jgi:hypothetical protein
MEVSCLYYGPPTLTPRERAPGIRRIRSLVDSIAILDGVIKRKLSCLCQELNHKSLVFQPVAITIPTELCRLQLNSLPLPSFSPESFLDCRQRQTVSLSVSFLHVMQRRQDIGGTSLLHCIHLRQTKPLLTRPNVDNRECKGNTTHVGEKKKGALSDYYSRTSWFNQPPRGKVTKGNSYKTKGYLYLTQSRGDEVSMNFMLAKFVCTFLDKITFNIMTEGIQSYTYCDGYTQC